MPLKNRGREKARNEACRDPVCGQGPLCAVLASCLVPPLARLEAELLGMRTGVSPTHYAAAQGGELFLTTLACSSGPCFST